MKGGELPSCGNIDQEAHWGKSGCGDWVFGYRLHSLTLCGPEGIGLPPSASRLPTAKTPRSSMTNSSTICPRPPWSCSATAVTTRKAATATAMNVKLLAPISKNTPPERREPVASEAWLRARLYQDPCSRELFALRKTTVEPFQGQLKDLFGLERLPLKRLANVRALCFFSVLSYVLLVALNLQQPPTQVKATLLALR